MVSRHVVVGVSMALALLNGCGRLNYDPHDGGATATGSCGNRIAEDGEQCDDGNLISGDGCEATCTFTCSADRPCTSEAPCSGAASCALTTHTCQPGTPLADGTDCGADLVCRGGACATRFCGNGVTDATEQCDDDNLVPDDGCENDCTFTCADSATCDNLESCDGIESCELMTHRCVGGSPLLDGSECERDGDPASRDICLSGGCTRSRCGDGFRDDGEQCDDGNVIEDDECSASCMLTLDAGRDAGFDGGARDGGMRDGGRSDGGSSDAGSFIDGGSITEPMCAGGCLPMQYCCGCPGRTGLCTPNMFICKVSCDGGTG